jgi:carbamoyl-phosphate synthase large subunit
VILGENKIKDFDFSPQLEGFAIKSPVFSFDKFPNVSKNLGPQMRSTGEAIYFIENLRSPLFKRLFSERNLYLSK